MVFRIRKTKFNRNEIVKSTNKNFKNSFHNINRPKKTFRLDFFQNW